MNTRAVGLNDQIRKIAEAKYVFPALRMGQREFAIPVKDLIDQAQEEGIDTRQRVPAFCTSIRKETFLRENNLEVIRVDGPPSERSTTVVIHYRVRAAGDATSGSESVPTESATDKAFRLTEKLRGLMKEEIAAHGGAEGFLRWVRSDEKAA